MKCFSIFFLSCFIIPYSFAQNCSPKSTDRKEILDTSGPNKYICHLIVTRKYFLGIKKSYPATASFISPNVIICAGHSLAEGRKHGGIIRISLEVCQLNIAGNFSSIMHKDYNRNELKIWCDPEFERHGGADIDLSYASLPNNLSKDYFILAEFDSIKNLVDSVHISGYPGDKDGGLWEKGCKSQEVIETNLVFQYGIYTFEGDSGAPIWGKVDNEYYIIGVHGTGNYQNSCNAGVRLTKTRISELQKFITDNKL